MRFPSGRSRVPVVAFLSGATLTLMSVAAVRGWVQDRPLIDHFNIEVDADEGAIEALYNFFPGRDRPEDPGALPPARQLAEERYELAGEALESLLQQMLDPPRAGRSGELNLFKDQLGTILELARIRTDARLDMAESDKEQIEVLSSEVAHARALLDLLRESLRSGSNNVDGSDIWSIDLHRLGLEHRLAVMTQRAPAPAEPGRPAAPPDPRLPEDVPDPAPADPAPEDIEADVDGDGVGIEALYIDLYGDERPVPIDEPDELSSPEQIAGERYEIAGKYLDRAIAGFNEPTARRFDEKVEPILEWSRYRLEARFDMLGSDEERARVLSRELAYTEAMLEQLRVLQRGTASTIAPGDLRGLELYRLELQQRLAQPARE